MNSKIVVGKPELLKKINRNAVIKLIFKHGEISRSEIAKLSQLTLPSVMRIVEGLLEEGLVIEVGKGSSTGGRKPHLLSMNHEHMYIIGVEIAIKIVVVLTDLSGKTISRWESSQMNYRSPKDVLNAILEEVKRMLNENQIEEEKIAGIGIGTPGTNFKYMKEQSYSILKGWENMDVKAWFQERMKCSIFIDNVARTRTLGELWFGIGKEIKDFIYVFVDHGVGCGIVSQGVIQEGYNRVAGEFGHSIIEYNGRECYCGNRGCLEMYVSAGTILLEISGDEKKDIAEILSREPDENVKRVLRKSGEILAAGISNLINIINPYALVIGGVVPVNSKLFSSVVLENIESNIFSKYALSTKCYISEMDMTYNCLGSVALVINEIFKSVTVTDLT